MPLAKLSLVTVIGLATLAACAAPKADPVTKCMLHTNAPGEYSYDSRSPDGLVVPGPGGTQAGAAAINACIRAAN